jgi:hypothetical protein
MTFKFIGALEGLTHPKSYVITALQLGVAGGFVIEVIRKLVKTNSRYRVFSKETRTGRITDFIFDAIVMPSPYASSFGGFVSLPPTIWFAAGGIISSTFEGLHERRQTRETGPASGRASSDMSATSLVGGGLIAGDSLAALGVGLYGLLSQLF